MEEALLILITFDTDYDFYYTPRKIYSQTRMKENMLSWSGLEEGIPIINENLRNFEDSYGNKINFTWFLLSDIREKEKNNDFAFIYKKYDSIWKGLTSNGDELGLHVHLIEKENDLWVQCINDDKNIQTLNNILKDWKEILEIKSIRFGYCYQSNRIMEFLEKKKFNIDSSALPRRKMIKRQYFDWEESPETPFHPSKSNYKIPGKESYNILEVPFSIFLSKLKDDKKPVYRYFNLSFHPYIIKDAIKMIVKSKQIIHSVTHFFEFIPRFNLSEEDNLLITFKNETLVQNLVQIINECKRINRPYQFIRMSDLLKYDFD